ncbi:MAG: UDP-2,3-diacylglucosamine diphosphatase [Bacteroidota bacterium]|nr:UDP-2,3-diacylglucosamine diphosphatase [Bacteroidota bacterium]
MKAKKKIYFLSDAHLGSPDYASSLKREKLLVQWLEEKSADAEAIYLVGDIFDFWYEYKHVVPRGFTRLFGTIAKLTDKGLPVYFFTGNHDIWVFGYLQQELGVKVIRNALETELHGKRFFIAHGDGLGPYDKKYNFLKKIFTSKFLQWCFSRIHPNFSVALANKWSKYSRGNHKYPKDLDFEDEWLVKYARDVMKEKAIDYFVFGHRHIPIVQKLDKDTTFINLGDWLFNFTYGEFDGDRFKLKHYNG